MTETDALIKQLQDQQAVFTQALKAALEGHWSGEGSVEAFLYTLDPNMTGTLVLDTPVTHSEDISPPKG